MIIYTYIYIYIIDIIHYIYSHINKLKQNTDDPDSQVSSLRSRTRTATSSAYVAQVEKQIELQVFGNTIDHSNDDNTNENLNININSSTENSRSSKEKQEYFYQPKTGMVSASSDTQATQKSQLETQTSASAATGMDDPQDFFDEDGLPVISVENLGIHHSHMMLSGSGNTTIDYIKAFETETFHGDENFDEKENDNSSTPKQRRKKSEGNKSYTSNTSNNTNVNNNNSNDSNDNNNSNNSNNNDHDRDSDASAGNQHHHHSRGASSRSRHKRSNALGVGDLDYFNTDYHLREANLLSAQDSVENGVDNYFVSIFKRIGSVAAHAGPTTGALRRGASIGGSILSYNKHEHKRHSGLHHHHHGHGHGHGHHHGHGHGRGHRSPRRLASSDGGKFHVGGDSVTMKDTENNGSDNNNHHRPRHIRQLNTQHQLKKNLSFRELNIDEMLEATNEINLKKIKSIELVLHDDEFDNGGSDGATDSKNIIADIYSVIYDLPDWYSAYDWVIGGYRYNIDRKKWTWMDATKSMIHWHNETINIWTEIIPGILFIVLDIMLRNEYDFWGVGIFRFGLNTNVNLRFVSGCTWVASARAFSSAFAHTFSFMSEKASYFWWTVDYVSITLTLSYFGISVLCVTFYCETWNAQISIMLTLITLCVVIVHATIWHDDYEFRNVMLGLFGILCVWFLYFVQVSYAFLDDDFVLNEYGFKTDVILSWLIGGLLFFSAVISKAIEMPEKLFNKRKIENDYYDGCVHQDYICTSHQLWHVLVNAAVGMFIWTLAKWGRMRVEFDTC